MAWFYLIIAGILEVAWPIGFKYANVSGKNIYYLFSLIPAGISFVLLSLAMRQIPVGTAYTVWVGIGVAGVVVFGALYFQEAFSLPRLLCLALIFCGVVGLKLVEQ